MNSSDPRWEGGQPLSTRWHLVGLVQSSFLYVSSLHVNFVCMHSSHTSSHFLFPLLYPLPYTHTSPLTLPTLTLLTPLTLTLTHPQSLLTPHPHLALLTHSSLLTLLTLTSHS